ncbi:hypothetical protein NLJ89_g455 [Agrocybe chaxingu]|uniref:Probable cytosolic iron-sulfur protein assembly protein 1 n=1 Tax=Agrocybe chaxingu TaxID=84603 RepID=A0A9W8TEW4_9AGAR|nr:hypothetical protein NLJ89_g455 [Agrocybe chaxingu]
MDIDLPYKLVPVAELPGHEDRAWHVAWNPKKPTLASCSADKTVRLYSYSSAPCSHSTNLDDANTSSHAHEHPLRFEHISTIPTGHAKTVRSVAWAPSGETLATASFDSNIGIWEKGEEEPDEDGATGDGEWECISTLEGHETECKSVAYSSTGTLLASCSRDKTVWIWEAHPDGEFETISVLMEHTQDVNQILASASYDDTIKLYIEDPSDDWFCFTTLSGHASTVWSLAWSPAGTGGYLASASDDKTVRIWRRVAEHKWDWSKGKQAESPHALGWLASAGGDGNVLIWELSEPASEDESPTAVRPPTHKLIANLKSAHGVHDVNSVVWCPRKGFEDLLATTGDDGYTRIWKIVPS